MTDTYTKRRNLVTRQKLVTLPIGQLFFSYQGRIGRQQFLFAYLSLSLLISVLYLTLDISILLLLAPFFIWPLCAVQTKRYHDMGKTGWWGLLQLVPRIGWFLVLLECGCTIGEFKDNRYGESLYKKS